MYRLFLIIVLIVIFFNAGAQVQIIDEDIQLVHLHDSVFIHISWHEDDNFGKFSSNGLVVISKGRALMVDTPADNEKTQRLVSWLKDSLSATVTLLIPGHFHNDCLGGLSYLQALGVKSLANILTVEKCQELQLPVPSEAFTEKRELDFYGVEIECRFFGPGHSSDNITIWLPSYRILFGGCLVKSVHSESLGNLSDALVEAWDETIKKIISTYKNIDVIVPGHGDPGGTGLLEHTLKLVEDHNNK